MTFHFSNLLIVLMTPNWDISLFVLRFDFQKQGFTNPARCRRLHGFSNDEILLGYCGIITDDITGNHPYSFDPSHTRTYQEVVMCALLLSVWQFTLFLLHFNRTYIYIYIYTYIYCVCMLNIEENSYKALLDWPILPRLFFFASTV